MFPPHGGFSIVTPRRALIEMAFHEAGHATVALLLGERWQSATLIKHKSRWMTMGYMGLSTTKEPRENGLIAAGGQIGEEIWRRRRRDGATNTPDAGASTLDMEIMFEHGDPTDLLDQARELLIGHEDLVARIARCLVRFGKVDVELVRKRLPRKMYTSGGLATLGSRVTPR